MARSLPGHLTPRPSPAQKVPNDVNIRPTTVFMAFSGTPASWRATTTPTPATTTMAAPAAALASPSWWSPPPRPRTMISTSRPSRNVPLKATTKPVASTRPLPAVLGTSATVNASTCCLKMASSSCLALSPTARKTALRNHCKPKTSSRAPTTARNTLTGTR